MRPVIISSNVVGKIVAGMNMSIFKNISRIGARLQARSFATGEGLVDVKVNEKTGVATVSMNRPPVNSLNYDLLETLYKTFSQLETDKCRGMILTSTSSKVFSAGLDILEMYKPNMDKARAFWGMLQNVWIKLYSSPYPTSAAINGHSPAGGCLLSLCCEHRVIVPNVIIGLNETQVGISAPEWVRDSMRNVIGQRKAEHAILTSKLFTSEEALAVGLVDEIANDKAEALEKSQMYLNSQQTLPQLARVATKASFRSQTLNNMLRKREEDLNSLVNQLMEPKVQEALESQINRLKKPKK
ncbi:enoyl-CoA delta isomerase 1, mitochondrial isoform X1 [Cimex lectularius]|uniref:Enoyl-CoA delta isomerase 1, mitochondrial n=1 Tax=Cimex lectularius TaxID=79782 RepID=A0A8I6TGJ9_CIMLE|nr:enoyl-CoA delta isomerase 1, mitochondrial isoform X1 [Cimex lectularius]